MSPVADVRFPDPFPPLSSDILNPPWAQANFPHPMIMLQIWLMLRKSVKFW